MTSIQRNARFWTYIHNGWVKITLTPDQQLSHSTGGPDEEGYSRECTTWSHEGRGVIEESHMDGRDCDGRVSSDWNGYCALEKLQRLPPEMFNGFEIPVPRPEWRKIHSWQRDYSAEAMGY